MGSRVTTDAGVRTVVHVCVCVRDLPSSSRYHSYWFCRWPSGSTSSGHLHFSLRDAWFEGLRVYEQKPDPEGGLLCLYYMYTLGHL